VVSYSDVNSIRNNIISFLNIVTLIDLSERSKDRNKAIVATPSCSVAKLHKVSIKLQESFLLGRSEAERSKE